MMSFYDVILGCHLMMSYVLLEIELYLSQWFCILADTQENATLIAQAVTVQQESVGKPILTTQEAIAAGSFFDNPGPADVVKVGDAKGGSGWAGGSREYKKGGK